MSSIGSQTIPRWQIAVLLGAPLAIGLGYLYLRKRYDDPEKKRLAGIEPKASISLDNTAPQKSSENALDKATKLKVAGNRAFHAAEYDKAITYYNEAIEACPTDHPIDLATYYQNRSACYEKREMWEKVKEDCSFALRLNEKYVKAFLRRSRAAEKSQDLALALEDVTAACILEGFQVQTSLLMADRILKALTKQHAKEAFTKRTPVMPSTHFIKTYFSAFSEDPITNKKVDMSDNLSGFFKAKVAYEQQNYDDIIGHCTQEIQNPDNENFVEALALRGTFYFLLGMHDEAMHDFNAVITHAKCDVKVKVNTLIKRASLFMQLDNADKCLADFTEASLLDSNNPDIYYNRGQVFLLMEKNYEALHEFNKAVSLNPCLPIASVQKCHAEYRYAQMERNVSALNNVKESFEKTIENFPRCAEAYTIYAQVLSEQQDYDRADALFEKAIEIDPQNAVLFVHKGILQLQKSTDVDKAVELLKKAISLDDKCEFALETLATIEVQRANLKTAVELFEKAIKLSKTELEMTHLFSLKYAAAAQLKASERWGLDLSKINPT